MRHLSLSKAASPLGILVLALLPVFVAPKETLTGWLAFCAMATTIVLGGFFFLLLADIIPGAWGRIVRPPAADLSNGMPWLALCLLPVLLGTHVIFPWSADTSLEGFRGFYLSPVSFALRIVLIMLLLVVLNRQILPRPNRALAIVSLIIFMLVQNLLATDLVLSLDPEFHSSGFGLYLLSVQALTAFSAMVLLRLGQRQAGRDETGTLGALLLVMLLCWAYFNFMQYFTLWSGNLPSRAQWFVRRGSGFWHFVSVILVWLRLVPAFLLLFRPFRQGRRWLLSFAAVSIVATLMELAWLILPGLETYGWASASYLLSCLAVVLLAYRLLHRGAEVVSHPQRRRNRETA